MKSDRFKELLDELDGNSLQTLKEKNARYSLNGDCLHNFKSGSEITGRTPAQTCWGYMSKHLTSLRDKVENDDFSDREDFLEKCQDTINYIRFLWCIGNDYEDEDIDFSKFMNKPEPYDEESVKVMIFDARTGFLTHQYTSDSNPEVVENSGSFDVFYDDNSVCNYPISHYYYKIIKKEND